MKLKELRARLKTLPPSEPSKKKPSIHELRGDPFAFARDVLGVHIPIELSPLLPPSHYRCRATLGADTPPPGLGASMIRIDKNRNILGAKVDVVILDEATRLELNDAAKRMSAATGSPRSDLVDAIALVMKHTSKDKK